MAKSIRVQLLLIQILSFSVLLCICLSSIDQVRRVSIRTAQRDAGVSFQQAKQGVESILDSVEIAAQSFGYSDAVQKLLHHPQQWTVETYVKAYNDVLHHVRFLTNTNPNIVDVALRSEDGKTYMFNTQMPLLMNKISGIYEQGESSQGKFLPFVSEDTPSGTQYYTYVYPINYVFPGEQFSQPIGECFVLCRTSNILAMLQAAGMERSSLCIEFDQGASVLAPRKQDAPSEMSTELNRQMLIGSDWELVQHQSTSMLYLQGQSDQFLIWAFLGIGVLSLVYVVITCDRNISRPIAQLTKQLTQNAVSPQWVMMEPPQTNNELSSIVKEINHMLTQILNANKENIESQRRLYEADILQRKLQFSALQSQINPHFLYNTLACIRGLALESEQDEIASVTVKMAKLFRYSIRPDTYVTLREEMSMIKNYIEIMNLRMEDKFSTDIDIEDVLLDTWMVKMVVQPLVENAIFHGLEGQACPGVLSIKGWQNSALSYQIEIQDNGAGMTADKLERLREQLALPHLQWPHTATTETGMGIGLINIHRKIRLLAGDDYGLSVESTAGHGTRVCIRMPVMLNMPFV